jgi:hypothetical protein
LLSVDKQAYHPGDEVLVTIRLKDIPRSSTNGLLAVALAVKFDTATFTTADYTKTNSDNATELY